MQSYQNTVNQAPIERSQADSDAPNAVDLEALLRERFLSLPSNFSKTFCLPNLLFSSDRSAKYADEILPKSGEFCAPNVSHSDERQISRNEECVDLERLLCANLDERVADVSANKKANNADDLDVYISNNNTNDNSDNNNNFGNAQAADSQTTTYPFIYNIKSENHHLTKDYISDNFVQSGSNSPVNVFSMEGSPCNEYLMLDGAMEVSPDHPLPENFFESLDSFIQIVDVKLPLYTPENSSGCPFPDFPDRKNSNRVQYDTTTTTTTGYNTTKRNQQPMLTLNLKDTFLSNEEINTPNIIDTIIDVSEHPVHFVRDREEIFSKSPFFATSLADLTPCPSASPPTVASDTTDSFHTTIVESPSPVTIPKKRGRPRKRRHDSDDDDEDDDQTYVPPSSNHKRRKQRISRAVAKKQIIYEDEEEEEEEDYKQPLKFVLSVDGVASVSNLEAQQRLTPSPFYEDETSRVGKRGRPPKHARSISSDDYSLLDPEEAKYREMRDRNNEASRKSRYKRKQKEVRLSDDCEYLENENLKLRAHVEELQKTVDRYRDNLMKVMLNKK